MPYADKEKQRKFQREWISKKKALGPAVQSKPKINQQILTPEALQKLNDDMAAAASSLKAATGWQQCIARAKEYVGSKQTDRLALATLAVQAVRIRHGGDRRTSVWREEYGKTLKEFAREVGVNDRTLSDWVGIKLDIADHLIEIDETFDMAIAQMVSRHRCENRLERYLELLKDSRKRNAIRFVKCIQDACNYITKRGVLEVLNEEQITKVTPRLQVIMKELRAK